MATNQTPGQRLIQRAGQARVPSPQGVPRIAEGALPRRSDTGILRGLLQQLGINVPGRSGTPILAPPGSPQFRAQQRILSNAGMPLDPDARGLTSGQMETLVNAQRPPSLLETMTGRR